MRKDNRDTIYRWEPHAFYDWSGMEQRLAEMAEQGWMLEKMGFLWKFRRCEPSPVKFSINYFPKASEYEPGLTIGQQTYQEYCDAAGWKLIQRMGKMQVFCSSDPEAITIENDPVTRVESIHKAMKVNLWAMFSGVLAAIWVLAANVLSVDSDPVEFLLGESWVLVPLLLFCGIYIGIESAVYYRWLHRARRCAAEEDRLLIPNNTGRREKIVLIAGALLVLFCILVWMQSFVGRLTILFMVPGLALVIAALNGIRKHMQNKGVSARMNRTVSLSLSVVLATVMMICVVIGVVIAAEVAAPDGRKVSDGYPLLMADMPGMERTAETERDLDAKEEGGWLAKRMEVVQRPEDMDASWGVHYTVTKVFLPGLIERHRDVLLRELRRDAAPLTEYRKTDPKPWRAESVYQVYHDDEARSEYLVCWKDRIAEIAFFWEPDAKQIAAAAEKLQAW